MQVLILGYGEMGHAMEALLGEHHGLAIWEKFPHEGFQPVRLEDAAPQADFAIFCLPAAPHREILDEVRGLLQGHCVCISVAKGLDKDGKPVFEVFQDVLGPESPFALLYGPMIAEDIRAGGQGFAQAGCGTAALFEHVAGLFRGSRLRLAHSTDLCGLSWCAVLKNVYAIGFGVVDELGWGDNPRGLMMVQSLRELERIAANLGGQPETCRGLAGLGDLVTTATSDGSHHHALGRKLARGETRDISGEGVHTLAMLEQSDLLNCEAYPLLTVIRTIIKDPLETRKYFRAYIDSCFP